MSNKLRISSSLIRSIYNKGDEREDVCPAYMYHKWIAKDISDNPTLPMLKGRYFETLCLGSSARGEIQDDLPRLKSNNAKSVDQQRIEEQVEHFKFRCAREHIRIDETNIQVPLSRRWEKDPSIILSCEKDIFPTTRLVRDKDTGNQFMSVCEIDLKLTANLETTYGEYCWGSPEHIDSLQAVLYLYISQDIDLELNRKIHGNLPFYDVIEDSLEYFHKCARSSYYSFYYWIFAYTKAEAKENKFVKVQLDSNKLAEMHESIRKTVNWMKDKNELGWPRNETNRCKKCVVKGCAGKNFEEVI